MPQARIAFLLEGFEETRRELAAIDAAAPPAGGRGASGIGSASTTADSTMTANGRVRQRHLELGA
jgi:hypothetical protein